MNGTLGLPRSAAGALTTQTDHDLGMLNIEIGVAPLCPAEFVIFRNQLVSPAAL
jgi:phage tail sheath protein FI